MAKADDQPSFAVTVQHADGRSAVQRVHTIKAARHYAKQAAAVRTVNRITLAGPGVASTLFAA